MKFRDKDGRIFDMEDAFKTFCDGRSCLSCQMADGEISGAAVNCYLKTKINPREAARLMGYEVIEDGEDTNAPTKKDENQPHICEKCMWDASDECVDCKGYDKFRLCYPADCDETPETCIIWGLAGCASCIDKSNFEPKGKSEQAEDKPVTRETILGAARKCVCGERAQDYGKVEDNFGAIREMWSTYLNAKAMKAVREGKPLTLNNADVAAMMIQVKLARQATGHAKADNWIDIAGYAACGGEIEGKEGKC